MVFGCCSNVKGYANVASCGYSYIELSGAEISAMDEAGFASARDMVLDGPIPCLGFNDYCRNAPAIVGPRYSQTEAAEYARRLCARGGAMGIRSIGIGAPSARKLPTAFDRELANRQCGDFLSVTCEEAAKYGIDILFEAVHEGMCNYATRTADALEMVKRLGLPNLHLVLDFYHMHAMGENVTELDAALPYLRHTHISTCGANFERGFPQANETEYYRGIILALRAGGYDGTMSVEAAGAGLASEGAGTLAMLKAAADV